MIEVSTWPQEETRTPDRACYWVAETTLENGRYFTARSRNGAPNELARLLAAAGIPDQPMQTYDQRGVKALYYKSFYGAAKWTYEESAHVPLRRVRWKPRPEGIVFGGGNAQNRGEPGTPGS
jgi:hypothetical protein